MWSLSGMGKNDASKYSMSVSMYRGGRGTGRPKTAPPDLPSLLLDARICYLGMPVSIALMTHVPPLLASAYRYLSAIFYPNLDVPNYVFMICTDCTSCDRTYCCSIYVVGL